MFQKWKMGLSLIILCIILLPGCLHLSYRYENNSSYHSFNALWNLDSYPMNVFIGIGAPYSSRDKMVHDALLQCARSIAIHEKIQMETHFVSESNSLRGLISFATKGKSEYFADSLHEILNRLKLIEVKEVQGEGVVVLASDPNKRPTKRPYIQSFDEHGTPTWIHVTPLIEGYHVAVGKTLGYRFLRDSLEASDVIAAEILLDMSAKAIIENKSYQLGIEGTSPKGDLLFYQEGLLQRTTGILDGFTVLARWFDSDRNLFYSLAIVPR